MPMKRTEIERLLPEVFRNTIVDGSPLVALLDTMERLHDPDEQVLANMDGYFDPNRTEDRFVPLLSRWLDLERLFVRSATVSSDADNVTPISTGMGRLRELVARAAYLSKWRGTRIGLIAFLETATGSTGFVVDEHVLDDAGRPRPFHVRVIAPAAVRAHLALIERIIDLEKPAYVTYELEFATLGT